MKIRWILAVGFLVAALISCQCLHKQSTAANPSRIQIDEHSVLIPGTAIADADREALTKIFRKYDSSLYRIAVYENGKLKKQIGKMEDMQMGEVAQEYARNAGANGLSNWITRIGNVKHVTAANTLGNPTHVTSVNQAGVTTHVTAVNQTGNPTHVTAVNQTGNPTHVTSVNQTGNPTHVTSVNHHPGRPAHVTTIAEESDALVQEVTPILEKYSK